MLTDADLPYPTVELSTGESVRLDNSGYETARHAPDRADDMTTSAPFQAAMADMNETMDRIEALLAKQPVAGGR